MAFTPVGLADSRVSIQKPQDESNKRIKRSIQFIIVNAWGEVALNIRARGSRKRSHNKKYVLLCLR